VSRPILLDLFAGAGGAAMGYYRAGFMPIGVDIEPQPNYPFEFHQGDAFDLLAELGADVDAIHASPPCQHYSTATADPSRHPDLYGRTRELLDATGRPWVIENVPGAPALSGVILCGSMFGLRVRRHRIFESSFLVLAPACRHREQGTPLGIYGDGGTGRQTRPDGSYRSTKAHRWQFAELMGMPWAEPREIVQAIPPIYTEWLGAHLLSVIERAA
jgi:DNA (cytosine-5)-methyltransferase 1